MKDPIANYDPIMDPGVPPPGPPDSGPESGPDWYDPILDPAVPAPTEPPGTVGTPPGGGGGWSEPTPTPPAGGTGSVDKSATPPAADNIAVDYEAGKVYDVSNPEKPVEITPVSKKIAVDPETGRIYSIANPAKPVEVTNLIRAQQIHNLIKMAEKEREEGEGKETVIPKTSDFVNEYFKKEGWDTKISRGKASEKELRAYDAHLNEATKAYTDKYGYKPFVESGVAKSLGLVFIPARAINPDVKISNLTVTDWVLGGAQLALLAVPFLPKIPSMSAQGVSGITFATVTTLSWDKMSPIERGVSVALDAWIIGSVAKSAISTVAKSAAAKQGKTTYDIYNKYDRQSIERDLSTKHILTAREDELLQHARVLDRIEAYSQDVKVGRVDISETSILSQAEKTRGEFLDSLLHNEKVKGSFFYINLAIKKADPVLLKSAGRQLQLAAREVPKQLGGDVLAARGRLIQANAKSIIDTVKKGMTPEELKGLENSIKGNDAFIRNAKEALKRVKDPGRRSAIEKALKNAERQRLTIVKEAQRPIKQKVIYPKEQGKYLPAKYKAQESRIAKVARAERQARGKPTPQPKVKTTSSIPGWWRKPQETRSASESKEQKEWEREFQRATPAYRQRMLEEAGIEVTEAVSPYIKTGTRIQELTQTTLQAAPQTIPKPQTSPQTRIQPETKTQPQTQPQAKTQPATQTEVKPETEVLPVTQTKPETRPFQKLKTEIPQKLKPRPPMQLSGSGNKGKEWTPQEIRSAIAWRDGFVVHAIKSPYRRGIDEATFSIKNLPEGLVVMKSFKGKGSQQASAKVTGKFPSKLTVDVGNQDVTATRRGNRVILRHSRDTTGTRSMTTIARGHNISRKKGRLYHTKAGGGTIISRQPVRGY